MVNREGKSKYSSMSSPESMNQSLNKFKELTTDQLKKCILQKSGIVSTTHRQSQKATSYGEEMKILNK